VVAIALLLPAGLAALGLTGVPVFPAHRPPLSAPGELALLVIVSSTAAVAAQWLRFPGGLIFGAMVSSAILHGTGWVTVNLPLWLTLLSFMILGAITGTRFANMDIRTLRHLAGAALGALIVGLGVAFACAVAAAWLLSLDAGPMTIAYAPGAIDAMMVLALALNYDAAFVGAHHLSRFVVVLAAMPLVVHIMQRMRRKSGAPDGGADGGG
jgi:membrane AbrB-like protein